MYSGVLLMILWTDRNRVVQASLWTVITTLVSGKSSEYFICLHLQIFYNRIQSYMMIWPWWPWSHVSWTLTFKRICVFPPSQNFIFTRKENKIIFLHEKFAIFLKIIANILNIAITLLKEAFDINNHKLYMTSQQSQLL